MFNNYPYGGNAYSPQLYSQYGTQMSGLKGRPVSSIEEVRAAQIDFDGSLFIFPDVANKKIYTKQINLDGTAALRTYSLVEEKPTPPPAYVTREELDSIVEELKSSLTPQQKEERSNNDKSKSAQTDGNNAVFAF